MRTQDHPQVGFVGSLSVWIALGYAAAGVPFDGGTGEPNDPYQIAKAEQLISIGSDPNLLSRHFVLVADVDLDPNLPEGKSYGKAVIAPSSQSPFSGSLDGAGYAIHNLTINAISRAALFGYVATGGQVRNLGLENAHVTAWVNVGGLVASNDGTISSCRATGSVTGRSGVGVLVGQNQGTVSGCHSTARVTGTMDNVGGLAGSSQGMISECYSTGTVTGTGFNVGGLVGSNDGMLSSCFASGSVAGSDTLGGLVGHNEDFGAVVGCYSTGNVMTGTGWGPGRIGGLVGSNDGSVSSCYSRGGVTGWEAVGPGRRQDQGGRRVLLCRYCGRIQCWDHRRLLCQGRSERTQGLRRPVGGRRLGCS